MKQVKKKRKLSAPARRMVSFGLLILSVFLCYLGLQDVSTTISLKESIRENLAESAELDSKKEELETTKENLSNPEYVEYMARGKYLVTKEGEQVFKFPSVDLQDGESQ